MPECLIGFGSNLGASVQVFEDTAGRLSQLAGVHNLIRSAPLVTKAISAGDPQPDYLNAVFRLQTDLSPPAVHRLLMKLEEQMGRERAERWQPRTLDLDLLLYNQHCQQTTELTLPHPRMTVRRFVLQPAVEIAAEMVHPVARQTLGQLLDHLNDRPNELLWVTRVNPFSAACRTAALARINRQHAANLVDRPPVSPQAWSIHLVQEQAEFATRQATAKLVCWSTPRPECMADSQFFGPQIELKRIAELSSEIVNSDLTSTVVTELVAAMEAANG